MYKLRPHQFFYFQVCGDTILWKSAETTPLVAIATIKIIAEVLENNKLPGAVASLCCGGADVGKAMAADSNIKLMSFTGSTHIGQQVNILPMLLNYYLYFSNILHFARYLYQ